mgnify:CR=1 FL=1
MPIVFAPPEWFRSDMFDQQLAARGPLRPPDRPEVFQAAKFNATPTPTPTPQEIAATIPNRSASS